jgi:hypothetical protein
MAEPAREAFAFQDEFPANCPPPAATPTNGVFYACHKQNPPRGEDFTTAAQRNAYVGSCECRRRAYSILKSLDDARGMMEAYPGRFRYVSRGRVTEHHGVCLATAGRFLSHYSLWRFASVSMHEIFSEQV